MIRILSLMSKPRGISPGQRFRLEQWEPLLLSHHGIAMDFAVFESPDLTALLYKPGHRFVKAALLLRDTVRRNKVLALARQYDAVVIYREAALLGPAIYERMLARTGIPIIVDFDDAIWLPAVGSVNGAFARLRFPGKTATICRMAQAVVVGNSYLAAYAARHNANVHIVPSTIDLRMYKVQPPLRDESRFVVTWSGSHSTLAHLETARGALRRLGEKRRVRLRVICDRPQDRPFEGVETEHVPWRAEVEAATLGQTHCGIMPLPDDEYSRGKCGMKALQYMAVGRPAVLSPVGVNAEIVNNGENGLLASDEDDWVRALTALADSNELREKLGSAGRRTVEERFSSEIGAAGFAGAVRSALARAALRSQPR